ncbi:MAG: hypothetical protein ACLSVD_03925 [Eggerthellaceae bacterium]
MDYEARRDPDAILKQIIEEEAAGGDARGKLKIFFGYAAGVGKTYAMLEEAHAVLEKGFDAVVGYIEPHTRADTMALVDGLEQIAPLEVKHRGIMLREFDLDAVLQRRPQIVLVDELAHTNAPGSRHKKRYQDIEELLRAGINVFTTVNVQHLEGLNDKIAAITHVNVAERIPDRVFDQAASVELVDIEPDDLIDRLESGKVYVPDRARTALGNFFSQKNLAALREIALRRMADRLTRKAECRGGRARGGRRGRAGVRNAQYGQRESHPGRCEYGGVLQWGAHCGGGRVVAEQEVRFRPARTTARQHRSGRRAGCARSHAVR